MIFGLCQASPVSREELPLVLHCMMPLRSYLSKKQYGVESGPSSFSAKKITPVADKMRAWKYLFHVEPPLSPPPGGRGEGRGANPLERGEAAQRPRSTQAAANAISFC